MKVKLDSRERLGVLFAVLALLLVVALLSYIPNGPRRNYEKARLDLIKQQEQLKQAQLTKADEEDRIARQQSLVAKLDARPKTFDLMAYLSQALNEMKLTERGARLEGYHTRKTSANQPMVQLSLQGVSLKELIEFLHKVYSSGNLITVYKADRIRPSQGNKGLDCDMVLATIKL
jgi:hypothetical protein